MMSILGFSLFFLLTLPLAFAAPGKKQIANLGQQRGFFEGDILLAPNKNRTAILRSKRWTNGIVPYTIDRTNYTSEDIAMIEEGMRTIERHTCVRFIPRTNHVDNLIIKSGGACFSTGVGMQGGTQYISLHQGSCMADYVVVHELFHAIGLFHEQSRYDRDQYLTIRWDRLNQNDTYSRYQLRLVPDTESSFYGIPYNYASVMHYDAWSLGTYEPGYFIMEPKDMNMLGVMGFAAAANETDFEKIRRIYECKGQYPVQPSDSRPCKDEWPDCDIQSDQCLTDKSTVANCRKTCGYCEWGKQVTATPRPYCQDYRPDCDYMADRCTKDRSIQRSCAYTCGACDKAKTPYPMTPRPCADEIDYCAGYISECGKEEWMKRACRKTCRLCN